MSITSTPDNAGPARVPAVSVAGLSCGYGTGLVLHDVDVEAPAGRLTLVVGRNGAGKTTLLRAISGLVKARSGTIAMGGEDITRRSPRARARAGLAHVQEGRRVFRRQSVSVNLELAFRNGRTSAGERAAVLQELYTWFPVLRDRRQVLAGALSGGQQQMLAIAQALAARPEVLLMDEPSLGLSPGIVRDVFDVVDRLRRRGITIILVEQMVDNALALADQVVVLRNGRVSASGAPGTPGLPEAIRDAYLGDQMVSVGEARD